MNISGSAENWISSKNSEKKDDDKNQIIKRKIVNINKELKTIENTYEKLLLKHGESFNKDLHDGITDLNTAIKSLKKI